MHVLLAKAHISTPPSLLFFSCVSEAYVAIQQVLPCKEKWNNTKKMIETQLLINNKLVSASDNATFDLFSPHTGEVIAKGTQSSARNGPPIRVSRPT
jgi:hypothetical protein